jgi:hypothetical protein
LVANSPGLIAGSYVLHRLLMPRHPPCALHSLSHKHSTKTTKTRNIASTCTTHTPTNPPPCNTHRKKGAGKHTHHAMLASTIQFTNNQPTNNHHPPHKMSSTQRRHDHTEQPAQLIPQSSTVCQPQPPSHDPPVPHPHHTPTHKEQRHDTGSTKTSHAKEAKHHRRFH